MKALFAALVAALTLSGCVDNVDNFKPNMKLNTTFIPSNVWVCDTSFVGINIFGNMRVRSHGSRQLKLFGSNGLHTTPYQAVRVERNTYKIVVPDDTNPFYIQYALERSGDTLTTSWLLGIEKCNKVSMFDW